MNQLCPFILYKYSENNLTLIHDKIANLRPILITKQKPIKVKANSYIYTFTGLLDGKKLNNVSEEFHLSIVQNISDFHNTTIPVTFGTHPRKKGNSIGLFKFIKFNYYSFFRIVNRQYT